MAENKPKEARRNEIIEAAVTEFLEKGYEGASIDSISKRAGLSKGGYYHHFKNKDEVLLAANYRYLEPINKFINEAKTNLNSADALKKFINDYLNYWSLHPRELQFTFLSISKMIPDKDMWDEITAYSKKMTAVYESLFIKGIMSGRFIKHDPKSRAVNLFAALQGITPFLLMNENFETEKAAQNLISIFVDEILK